MKNILKTQEIYEGIMVYVEDYPHAQPVFPIDTPPESLQGLVDAWSIIQDEIDTINNGTATQEIIDKHKPKIPFNAKEAIGKQAKDFTVDRIIALAPFTYTINTMIEFENWIQLKELLNGLMQAGYATNGDYNKLNKILKEQNIDLDNY